MPQYVEVIFSGQLFIYLFSHNEQITTLKFPFKKPPKTERHHEKVDVD